MNPIEIEEAFAAGKIDARFRHELLARLVRIRRMGTGQSPLREIMDRVRVVQQTSSGDTTRDMLPTFQNLPGAQQRPGMVSLFRNLHQGSMRDTSDDVELVKSDTPSQIESIVRVEVQAATAKAIRQIWQPMKGWFDRRCMVIPVGRLELVAPTDAETVIAADAQTRLAVLPYSPQFAEMFGSQTVEQTMALLKRAVEEMGRYFAYAWIDSSAAREGEFRTAMKLMSTFRELEFVESICNGFASGASDVLNPLHNLVLSVVESQGPEVLTDQLRQRIGECHEDFSVFQAMFGLDCLAMLEHVLRVPASVETKQFLRTWTHKWPDFHGKGCPLDCLYDRKYFLTHFIADESGATVPLIDFDMQSFSPSEIELMSSRKIRLGCPSLGSVHRAFTRAMCECYFAIVWPQVAQQSGSP